jgi:hypothetical protein
MTDKKEPQSYGSQDDWVAGHTAQKTNLERPRSFDDDRESDTSAPHQGGDTSPIQSREHAMPSGAPTDDARKVSVQEGGAKRGGYFKERDYEGKK